MPKSSFQLVISALTQLVMIVVLLLGSHAQAQEVVWVKTYGGYGSDRAWGSCPTADGGFVLVGFTTVYGYDIQIYMVKTDSKGDTLWTRVYGGYGWDQANSVQPTADGGYVMAGWGDSYGNAVQAYLIKTNSRGDTLWFRTYGGVDLDDAISVQQTSDGGYIFVGSTHSYGAGHWDVYLVKTDFTGVPEWTRVYGGVADDRGTWVEQTTDGGYIVSGYTESFAPYRGVYLIKTDSQGDTLWTRALDASGCYFAVGKHVQQTLDGGYIVTGWSTCNPDPGSYDDDVILIKTDANGDTVWTRHFGGGYPDWGHSVRQTSDSGYLAVGFWESREPYDLDVYLIKTDSQGDSLWTRTYGGGMPDVGANVLVNADGTCIVSGETKSCGAGSIDFYLVKIDPSLQGIVRGDGNGDGAVNSSDVVYLINYLFRDGSPPEPPIAGDANCDGLVGVEDLIYLINYLFAGGTEPGCECA